MSKGGIHLTNEQDVFSFDLNESLYFEKGQEVLQMLGISLEPEISIQSFNEYVSIRGVIELHGEYEKVQADVENDELPLDFNDHQSHRYFEQIENKEDNLAIFSHRFPVEISVPSYRVEDMNDIKVSVASFDYQIPEENQLKLISTIEIQGISDQTVLPDELNEKIEREVTEEKLEVLEDFQFELKDELHDNRKRQEIELESVSETVEQKSDENEDGDVDKDRWKYKQSQSLEEFFKVDKVDDNGEIQEADMTEDVEDVPPDSNVQEETDPEVASERKPSYLADIFGGDDLEQETKYEQMRICIVQDQDTLESISERYQIPKLQILKLNRLADDDLAKGQLLTIPSKGEK